MQERSDMVLHIHFTLDPEIRRFEKAFETILKSFNRENGLSLTVSGSPVVILSSKY